MKGIISLQLPFFLLSSASFFSLLCVLCLSLEWMGESNPHRTEQNTTNDLTTPLYSTIFFCNAFMSIGLGFLFFSLHSLKTVYLRNFSDFFFWKSLLLVLIECFINLLINWCGFVRFPRNVVWITFYLFFWEGAVGNSDDILKRKGNLHLCHT